jgi:hypothetical protein
VEGRCWWHAQGSVAALTPRHVTPRARCRQRRHFGIYDDAKALLASADTNSDGMID